MIRNNLPARCLEFADKINLDKLCLGFKDRQDFRRQSALHLISHTLGLPGSNSQEYRVIPDLAVQAGTLRTGKLLNDATGASPAISVLLRTVAGL